MSNELIDRVIDGLDAAFKKLRIKKSKERAQYLGYTPAYYSSLVNGNERITDELMYKIAEKLDLNFNWLKYGEGEMFKSQSTCNNTINNVGDFCANTIESVAYGKQLSEMLKLQAEMVHEKDRQINELLQIIKNKGA